MIYIFLENQNGNEFCKIKEKNTLLFQVLVYQNLYHGTSEFKFLQPNSFNC